MGLRVGSLSLPQMVSQFKFISCGRQLGFQSNFNHFLFYEIILAITNNFVYSTLPVCGNRSKSKFLLLLLDSLNKIHSEVTCISSDYYIFKLYVSPTCIQIIGI